MDSYTMTRFDSNLERVCGGRKGRRKPGDVAHLQEEAEADPPEPGQDALIGEPERGQVEEMQSHVRGK